MNEMRPPRAKARKHDISTIASRYDRVALVVQGSGALGAYQIGVHQALAEAGREPNWISGVSIGAINSAIIGGDGPEKRLQNLEAFWSMVHYLRAQDLGLYAGRRHFSRFSQAIRQAR